MLRKETKCVFLGKPKQFRKCDAYFSTSAPPKHALLGSKPSFCLPPTQKKMGVDTKHLELCNKHLQLLKNSTGLNFSGTRKTHPKHQGTGSMDHHGPWYTSEPKSPGRVEVGHLPRIWPLSCPYLGNPYNGYIRTPTYWVDDWWPSPICMVKFEYISKPELRGLLQQGIPSEPTIDWGYGVTQMSRVHSAPTPIVSWKHLKISSDLSYSVFFFCCLRFAWVCAHSAIYDEFFQKRHVC